MKKLRHSTNLGLWASVNPLRRKFSLQSHLSGNFQMLAFLSGRRASVCWFRVFRTQLCTGETKNQLSFLQFPISGAAPAIGGNASSTLTLRSTVPARKTAQAGQLGR